MSFRPLHNYIVIEPDPDPPAEQNGIVIPETALDSFRHNGDGQLQTGKVVELGPGHLITKGVHSGTYAPWEIKVGDRIIYPKHQLVPMLENKNVVIHEQHVYGVVEERV